MTVASSFLAAKENKPLPQHISKNNLSFKSSKPKRFFIFSLALSMRSSLIKAKKFCQFLPNSKCSPSSICFL